MIKILARLVANIRGWFAYVKVRIGNVSLFSRTYRNELYIVCGSIEELYRFKCSKAVIKRLKGIVEKEMIRNRMDKKFDRFLVKKGLKKGE